MVTGNGSEALLESFEVLEGENRGGRKDGNLFVIGDGLEGGTHGDFGFAVADVAAEQAIHGLGRFHVANDVFDGLGLIFGFVELEGVFEFAEPFVAGRKGVSDGCFTLGVKFEQLIGHVFHGLLDASFGLRPGLRAEMTQDGLRALRRAIFLDEIEAGERDIEAGGFGEFEQA